MSILPLILALSVTIDNVVIGQATTLSPRKVAVMSAAIHLSLLMIGTGFAPILSNLLPDLVRWLSPALFCVLGILSLSTAINHKSRNKISSLAGTATLSFFLAFDALFLGLTPAVSANLGIVIFGVILFSPCFVFLGRATVAKGAKVTKPIGYAEAGLFFALAVHAL